MDKKLKIYNTLTRQKEDFEPLNPPFVGMYVCGPTVYGDPHLGHARPAITFDLLFRYLKHIGYKVRYVRNITDVGHLLGETNDGEDRILKKARLEKLEPMEVVQYYTLRYNKAMEMLNALPPSIEPRASGHIIEQIEFIEKIIDAGYAYESNGSIYFDVEKYNENFSFKENKGAYGKLSGRNIDELLENTRELEGQSEKRRSMDFALWKKASPEHIMRWNSRWSEGFPGWHLECSAMGTKYLGEQFDIHGGGMDLMFPHHECEIAQSTVALGHESVKYWVHNNMITIEGQKMSKSAENFITLEEFFTGNHKKLTQAFSPMTIRFFILQAHYRSTVDFSCEALSSAEKGLQRLMEALSNINKIKSGATSDFSIETFKNKCYDALNDDLNSPILIAHLFDAVKVINSALAGTISITETDIKELSQLMRLFTKDILGLVSDIQTSDTQIIEKLINLVLDIRQEAKNKKDWTTSDQIRNKLNEAGIVIKDGKDGVSWSF